MVSLAKANLLHEKSKIILSVAGVILAVFLIFATTGLYYGITTVVENMVLKAGADLWVTSQGSSGSLHSPSLLSNQLLCRSLNTSHKSRFCCVVGAKKRSI